eukprot:scaffold1342_cov120-Isochrysis_galbana.AAC.3
MPEGMHFAYQAGVSCGGMGPSGVSWHRRGLARRLLGRRRDGCCGCKRGRDAETQDQGNAGCTSIAGECSGEAGGPASTTAEGVLAASYDSATCQGGGGGIQ